MKQFIYTVAILCAMFFVSSCKNEISSDNKKFGLNRIVKSVQVKTYEVENKFGEIFKDDISEEGNYLALFDAKGNLISITDFDEDGDVNSKMVYEYDAKNRVTKQIEYDWKGRVDFSLELLYQGEYIIKEKFIRDYGVWLLEYKRNGVEIQENVLMVNSELVEKRKYLESTKARWLYVAYDGTGKEIRTVQCDFDKKGNILKETISRGNEVEVTSYLYNKAGFVTEISTTSCKSEARYNEKNLPVYIKGGLFYHNTEVHLIPNSNHEEDIYYFEYEYDDKGNWIKQIVYKGEMKDPYTLSERVISY